MAVTAGYICPEPRVDFFAGMDAANVDLKAFTEDFYQRLCGGSLQPVLDTLSYLARETEVWFEPEHFQQMAGLICYYNASKFHYLYISRDDEVGKHLAVMSCEGELLLDANFPDYADRIPLPEGEATRLRARVAADSLRFSWSDEGGDWRELPLDLDASLLSDEAGKGEGAQFTGAFVGMCCQDLAGTGRPADFAWFSYRPLI